MQATSSADPLLTLFYVSPFRFLAKNNKVYGFNIAVIERADTVPTLYPELALYRDGLLEKGQVGQSNFCEYPHLRLPGRGSR